MIVECKNCKTKFTVPDNAIGENGRIVNCSVCKYEWLYKPEKGANKMEDSLNSAPKNLFDNSNALKKYKIQNKIPLITASLILLCFITILFSLYNYRTYIVDNFPIIKPIYEKFGYYNVNGLEIIQLGPVVGEKNNTLEDMKQFKIPVLIKNTANVLRKLDSIQVTGYSEDKTVLFSISVKLFKDFQPEETSRISVISPIIREKPKFIIVKIGKK